MLINRPAQILVVDRVNGPANILIDVLSRLFEQVSVVAAVRDDDAFNALNSGDFDLIIVGWDDAQTHQFSLLRDLRNQHAYVPILVVGHRLSQSDLEHCHKHEVQDVIELPHRAAELKSAVFNIAHQYLQCL
jgi:DNA-binding response OmpR family regulator